MNSTMRIKRPLPPAPKPTRPIIVKEVQGISHHLEVRPEKPPVGELRDMLKAIRIMPYRFVRAIIPPHRMNSVSSVRMVASGVL